jgi:hypothetical protein
MMKDKARVQDDKGGGTRKREAKEPRVEPKKGSPKRKEVELEWFAERPSGGAYI